MSKAVLVLDEMPRCCLYCQFAVRPEAVNSIVCIATEKDIAESWLDLAQADWDPDVQKPDWCPLRKAPERWTDTIGGDMAAIGYNMALDDLGV